MNSRTPTASCLTPRFSALLECAPTMSRVTFQSLILRLQNFWAERGCILETPLDLEVGADTNHEGFYVN